MFMEGSGRHILSGNIRNVLKFVEIMKPEPELRGTVRLEDVWKRSCLFWFLPGRCFQSEVLLALLTLALMLFQDQRSSLASAVPAASAYLQQNVLSHLPLHSQQQVRSLLPVVPVGGLQAPHPPPSPAAATTVSPPSAQSPQSSEGPVTAGEEIGDHLENPPAPLLRDSRQEESVQTCLKAIASLKITAEPQ